MLWLPITEIVQQVTAYGRIFLDGYHHLIPGKIIKLPANHAIPGLQSGSFRAPRFQNGKCPKSRVHFYGYTGNVCYCPAFAVQQKLIYLLFRSGRWKKRLLVREAFLYSLLGEIYSVFQLYDCRKHPCHAESWTRIVGNFLL